MTWAKEAGVKETDIKVTDLAIGDNVVATGQLNEAVFDATALQVMSGAGNAGFRTAGRRASRAARTGTLGSAGSGTRPESADGLRRAGNLRQ